MVKIRVDKAIENMKFDIINSNVLFGDINNWYYICIHANDNTALISASRLLELLHVFTKSITMTPRTYKKCPFDCFSVSSIFNNVYSTSCYNIDIINIIEQSELEDGNFYLSIVKQNKSTKLVDITTYKTFKSYYE